MNVIDQQLVGQVAGLCGALVIGCMCFWAARWMSRKVLGVSFAVAVAAVLIKAWGVL